MLFISKQTNSLFICCWFFIVRWTAGHDDCFSTTYGMCAVFFASLCHFISMFQSLLTTQTTHANTINIEQSFNDKLLCQFFLACARSGSIKINNEIFRCRIDTKPSCIAVAWLKRGVCLCDFRTWAAEIHKVRTFQTCAELLRNLSESDCGWSLVFERPFLLCILRNHKRTVVTAGA